MYPKAILPIALIALTLSAHATPINTQRTNLKEISNLLRKRGATENAEAEAGNPLSAISGLLGGAGGAAGGDLLNNLPIKREVAKRAPLDLSDITGAIGGAGAKGDAAAAGDADAGNPLSAISGLLGGAGGAAGGDLLNNLPIKRDVAKRAPLDLSDITGAIGGAGAKGDAAAAGDADAGNPLSAISGLLGGAGGAAGGDLLNNLPIKRDVAKRAPLDLSDITGAIGGAGAKGDAAAAGDADAGNPLSAISGLLGGAGGAAGGDLLNNLPIKREVAKRAPLDLSDITGAIGGAGAKGDAAAAGDADAGNPLSAISGLLGGAGGAAGGDLLNNLPIKREVAKRAPLDLSDITGAIGGAGAKGDAAAAGDADAGNPLSAISGLLGGAGGAAGGDLLNNLPIKREVAKRAPLDLSDITGAIGGAGAKGDAAAAGDADAGNPLSAISGLLGGAGGAAGGAAGGDLLNNLPIKRDNIRREPLPEVLGMIVE
ncbi:hypothetical protein HI914_02308 [Erysiphe necator]|nr:hypothetical protein HI914_02308 [Erysiphe necator]